MIGIVITIGTGENYDAKFHKLPFWSAAHSKKLLLNLHAKVFNYRVRQNLVRQPRCLIAGRFLSHAVAYRNLEIFSLTNVADALKSEQLDRMFNGLALRIQNAGL